MKIRCKLCYTPTVIYDTSLAPPELATLGIIKHLMDYHGGIDVRALNDRVDAALEDIFGEFVEPKNFMECKSTTTPTPPQVLRISPVRDAAYWKERQSRRTFWDKLWGR